MNTLPIPQKEVISENNQAIFDTLEKNIGFVPNMYAFFAHSPTALNDYLTLQHRKSTLRPKEKEAINLIVSELNGCDYCKAAHTAIGEKMGFTASQILEIRKGTNTFDPKLNILLTFVKEIVIHKGHVSDTTKELFLTEYTLEHLVDVVMIVGDKIITNYLFAIAKVPIDFPEVKQLS